MKARSWLSLQGQSNYVTSRINFNEVLLIFLPSSKIGEGSRSRTGSCAVFWLLERLEKAGACVLSDPLCHSSLLVGSNMSEVCFGYKTCSCNCHQASFECVVAQFMMSSCALKCSSRILRLGCCGPLAQLSVTVCPWGAVPTCVGWAGGLCMGAEGEVGVLVAFPWPLDICNKAFRATHLKAVSPFEVSSS